MNDFESAGASLDVVAILNQQLLQLIFHNCGFRNEEAVVNTLIDHPDQVHNILRAASLFGWEDMALTAIANGADIHYAPEGQNNAFHNAIMRGHTNIMQYFIAMDPEILNTLNGYGFSALRNAVHNNQLQVVILLLNNGANIYAINDDGESPLSEARAIGGEIGNRLEINHLLLNNNNINREIYQNGVQITLEDMVEVGASMALESGITVSSGFLALLGALFIPEVVC